MTDNENIKTAGALPWIIFSVCGYNYAISIKNVTGIVSMPTEITPVPAAPEVYRGITNIRGTVHSVLDMRKLFGYPALDAEAAGNGEESSGRNSVREVMVTLSDGKNNLAIVVDKVLAVDEIKPVSGAGNMSKFLSSQYFTGVAHGSRVDDDILVVNEEEMIRQAGKDIPAEDE